MTALATALLPALVSAAPWELGTALPDNGYTSQKVELVDINADGFVDIVFANSSGNEVGNQANAQLNQLIMNDAGMAFNEAAGVFEAPDNAYVIKAGDVDNDGDADLVVGVNFADASYVLINDNGAYTKQELLSGLSFSIGDLELGDVDGDGDLDIFAADWGMSQPYGDPDDLGGPLHLWLGDGMGGFTSGDAMLPMGMEVLASWSFDVELVDFDNDLDLDAMISTRGFGKALVFANDGGTFTNYPVPALQPMTGKNVNVAFTPLDLNNDEFPDVVTLQDGAGGGACVEIDGDQYCAKRNSVLINDTMGQFTDNPGMYWDIAANPPKLDFDAATLDFNNDGFADIVTTGLRLGGTDSNSRLLINNGTKITTVAPPPNDAAFPTVPELSLTFGLAFADFNNDNRVDAAVAVRDGTTPNYTLIGGTDDATGVPADTTPPKLGPHEVLKAPLFFGKEAAMRGRGHDYKTPTAWHDYQYDDKLSTYNITEGALTAHNRRLPYMEFALSLANADDIKTLPDDDPSKYISPSVWLGEALWRVAFKVPYNGKKMDTLTWQFCAIDAAGNKSCLGPFQVEVTVDPTDCGNGMVEPWETCDDPNDVNCVMCENTCGNGVCDPNETSESCPEDCGPCDNDGICEPPEDNMNCPNDCPCDNDGMCEPPENEMNCPNDCTPDSDSGGMCDNDGVCEPANGEDAQNCPDCVPEPTGTVCGDGVCEAPEDAQNCPEDCHCGNDICEADLGEDPMTCPVDCDGDTATDTACPDSAGGVDGQCQLDDDHPCNCQTEPGDTRGLWASLLLFGAFGVRRSRRRA